jgi:light-regulated signal transduction histidine kinase (bacteriophytochrome)
MTDLQTPLTEAQKIALEFKQFAYIVSHDLSTSLRGMVEFSKLLKAEAHEALNADSREYLTLIVESGEKLQTMIIGLLDYSRLNTMSQSMAEVNCNRILSDCQLALEDKIKASKAKLDIATLPTVMADVDQLMQLFFMLLDNALKFQPEGNSPQISVSAEKKDAEWVFTVRDNGIGIEEHFYTRVFQPFQRLHTESEYSGTGMGLALAKKIVDRHGGQIWINSTHDQGTTFHFTLPYQELSR